MENFRKILEETGVPEEHFDSIIGAVKKNRFIPYERFEEVNRQKKESEAERAELEKQFEDALSKRGDYESAEAKISELEGLLKTRQDDFDEKINENKKTSQKEILDVILLKALNDAGAKNHTAVRALMDFTDIKDMESPRADELFKRLSQNIECLREEHPYLFGKSGIPAGFRVGCEHFEGSAPKGNVTKAFGN